MSATMESLSQETKTPSMFEPKEWQLALIGLMARLDHTRIDLLTAIINQESEFLLNHLENLIRETEEFASKYTFSVESAKTHAESLAKTGGFISMLSRIKGTQSRGLFRGVLNAFSGSELVDPVALRQCLLAAHEALNTHFTLFSEQFPNSQSARGWVELASIFLTEFKYDILNFTE
jgi:hypothetical protein